MKTGITAAILVLGLCGLLSAQTDFNTSVSEFKRQLAGQTLVLPVPEPVRLTTAPEITQYIPEDSGETGYDWATYDAPQIEYGNDDKEETAAPRPGHAYTAAKHWDSYDARNLNYWAAYDAPGTQTPISSIRGGLPGNIAAFLDTIAYAEGTRGSYNYIFTFATFNSYRDHPRRVICSGWLCSNAAGRYQFLAETWDPLRRALGLNDFSPRSQDKAALELIRRAGAYQLVANSSNFNSFAAALQKLNRIWASFPGSPYGQPTRSTAELWQQYRQARAFYRG